MHPLRTPAIVPYVASGTSRAPRPPLGIELLLVSGPVARRSTGTLVRDAELGRLEAALFEAREPLTLRQLARVASLDGSKSARWLLRQLGDLYEAELSPFTVEEIGGGYQLLTRARFHQWLFPFRPGQRDLRLSSAAMETLSIVAYRQPIMRAEIDGIRGVQSGDVLRLLIERGLVRIAGRHASLGRPVLYGTTARFLREMGLNDLQELPHREALAGPVANATPAG